MVERGFSMRRMIFPALTSLFCAILLDLNLAWAVSGETLACQSKDGTILFSPNQMTYMYDHEVPLPDGKSMRIPQAESVRIQMQTPAFREPKNLSFELQAEVERSKLTLLEASQMKTIRLVAPVTDPVFIYKKTWSDIHDYGDYTYETSLAIIELSLNDQTHEVHQRTEKIDVICYYHYFTECGENCR